MGYLYGISCKDCDFEQIYHLGCGKFSRRDELAMRAEAGEFGSVAKFLLSDECPIHVEAFITRQLGRCENCSSPIEWETLLIALPEDEHAFKKDLKPETCPRCAADFCEEPSPLTADFSSRYEILGWLWDMANRPCPKCGGWNCVPVEGSWT